MWTRRETKGLLDRDWGVTLQEKSTDKGRNKSTNKSNGHKQCIYFSPFRKLKPGLLFFWIPSVNRDSAGTIGVIDGRRALQSGKLSNPRFILALLIALSVVILSEFSQKNKLTSA